MTRARVSLAIAFSALAITACGGGGDDDNGTDCATNPTAAGCTSNGNNTAPTAKANGPYQSIAGAAVSLSAAGSSDTQDRPENLKYEWVLSNAVVATGAQTSYTFATAGTYQLTLRVTDTGNLAGTETATVTVTAAAGGGANGTIGIVLTDAAFPFDTIQSANVFVARVDAQIAEPTSAEANANLAATTNTNPNTGWVTVATPNARINLLDLQGGRTRTLSAAAGAAVAAGTYRGFRLILDAAQSSLVFKSGTAATVQWGTTGLVGVKVTPTAPVAIGAGAAVNVLVDFDLGRGFDLTGATPSAGFTFLRDRALRTVPPSQTGSDIGLIRVDDVPAPGVTVEILTAGTAAGDLSRDRVVATTSTDAQGVYRITNLAAGSYVRRFTFPERYRVQPSNSTFTVGASTATAPVQAHFDFESPR